MTPTPRHVQARSRQPRLLLAAGVAVTGATAPRLLRRMRRELASDGSLTSRTVAAMYGLYLLHAATTAVAAACSTVSLPVPAAAARALGVAGMTAGATLAVGGMSRFGSTRQLSGLGDDALVTGGIYRYSRHPQYLGYTLALVGLAVATRSAEALAMAGGYAGVTHCWVQVEERHLAEQFGDRYLRYRRHAPKWLGRPGQRLDAPPPPDAGSRST